MRYGSKSLTRMGSRENRRETRNVDNSFKGFCYKDMERERVVAREGRVIF